MKLRDLLNNIRYKTHGNSDLLESEVLSLSSDSRNFEMGTLFFALKGVSLNGHDFIHSLENQGVVMFLGTELVQLNQGGIYIQVEDAKKALGIISSRFYDDPSHQLKVVGVTGTNGKTTIATLLFQLFKSFGYKTGLISTVENKINDIVIPATHTTPDAISLHALLASMRDHCCEYVFMEISSHAIDQDRIYGLKIEGAVFSNISHDHLDYHGNFQNYIYAKKKLFDQLGSKSFALVNMDDKRGPIMIQNTEAHVYKYGLYSDVDYKGKIIENTMEGLCLEINQTELNSRLVGDFNAYNLLAVYGTALLLGEDKMDILEHMSLLVAAEGRFDRIYDELTGIHAIVDYAHTPDALDKVLETVNKMRQGSTKIITVFGCGGNRDKAKRPEMGRLAVKWSDRVIITSDNPRNENPMEILKEIESGIDAKDKHKVFLIEDRRQAIRISIQWASKGDIVLVAGKGHEKYQELAGVKYIFEDREEIKLALEELKNN